MAVDVAARPTFAAGVPRPLFEINVMDLWQDARNHYDVSRDGARFLVASPVENTKRLPLTVVVNWQGRRSVPAEGVLGLGSRACLAPIPAPRRDSSIGRRIQTCRRPALL